MIAVEKLFGHFKALQRARFGVLGVFQQAIRETLLAGRAVIAQYPGQEPHEPVDEHQRGELPTRENKVTNAEFEVYPALDEALIDTLAAATEESTTGRGRDARQ